MVRQRREAVRQCGIMEGAGDYVVGASSAADAQTMGMAEMMEVVEMSRNA